MKPTVYVETTIISYLAARQSADLVVRAHQALTRRLWRRRRACDLHVSPLVIEEAARGDPGASRRRRRLLHGIPLLAVIPEARAVARRLLNARAVAPRAEIDALHIALAAVHGIEYLVTWNCRHIANARLRGRIEEVIRGAGYEPPVVCTPEELLGE